MHVNSKPKEHVHGFGYTPSFTKVVKGNEVQEFQDTLMVLKSSSLNYRGDPVLLDVLRTSKPSLISIMFVLVKDLMGVEISYLGTPLQAWSRVTFNRIVSKWGELVYMDESNASNKYSMRLCVKTMVHRLITKSFKVILKGKVLLVRAKEVTSIVNEYNFMDNSFDHVENSPGKMQNSPDHLENFNVHMENSHEQLENSPHHVENFTIHVENSTEQMENFPDYVENSSIHVENSHAHLENSPGPYEDPFGLEKLILESEKMHQCRTSVEGVGWKGEKQWVKTLCHSNQVNFLSLQETKMVSFNVFMVKALWGNMLFDFDSSSACGRSGGEGVPDNLLNRSKTFHDVGVIDRIFLRRLGVDFSHDLEGDIYVDEIKKAVWDFGEDVSNAVKEFFNLSIFPDCCNPSFIAVIPKQVIDRDMFVPILVEKNDLVPISHLFYADDAMFIAFEKHLEEKHATCAQFGEKLDKNTTF
nr:RNA-directed DNA polymerase, eukaryota [Tanacetum cinerariifolium]